MPFSDDLSKLQTKLENSGFQPQSREIGKAREIADPIGAFAQNLHEVVKEQKLELISITSGSKIKPTSFKEVTKLTQKLLKELGGRDMPATPEIAAQAEIIDACLQRITMEAYGMLILKAYDDRKLRTKQDLEHLINALPLMQTIPDELGGYLADWTGYEVAGNERAFNEINDRLEALDRKVP